MVVAAHRLAAAVGRSTAAYRLSVAVNKLAGRKKAVAAHGLVAAVGIPMAAGRPAARRQPAVGKLAVGKQSASRLVVVAVNTLAARRNRTIVALLCLGVHSSWAS